MANTTWSSLGFPAPAEFSRKLVNMSGVLASQFSGAIQIVQRPSLYHLTAKWRLVDSNYRKDVIAFLLSIEKTADQVRLDAWEHVQRGTFGGSPLINGASQTGRVINIDGATPSVTNWIRRGDWIRLGTAGNALNCFMAANDSDSNGSGEVAVTLTQAIFQSPDNNDSVNITMPQCSRITYKCMEVSEIRPERTASSDVLSEITATFIQDVLVR